MSRRTTAALLITLMAAVGAHAGSISITTTQSARYEDGKLVVGLTIANSGDEAAHGVSPRLRFREAVVRGTRHDELAPGGSVNDELGLDVGVLGPGRWIYAVGVDYADANQYPFQALQMGSVTIGNVGSAKVAATKVTAEPLAKDGELTIELKNLAGVARTVSVTTHVPEGLEVLDDVGETSLEPWGERVATVRIANRTALPGSRYPIFVAIEYDADDEHHGVIAQGLVEITSAANVVERHGDTFWMWALALALLFVVLLAARLLRR